jgi:uncharacterized protein (DUF697 family)/GTP-binding protein EngB required for normal cell division
MDIANMADAVIDAINQNVRDLKKLNIAVVGKTGVGKSTLINSVFREDLAAVGIGQPVTSKIRKYYKKDFPLTIYDTPGFELGKDEQENVKNELLDIIKTGNMGKDVNEAIHCIWYCINTTTSRIEPEEIKWLRSFSSENRVTQVPIIVVLTQACPKQRGRDMKAAVEAENLDVISVIPVLAQDMDFDGEYLVKAYGLDTLIDIMSKTLPAELEKTLQNVQKASMEAKKKYAQGIVATAVAAAMGEAAIPVPFADATMLVPTQISMIAGITAVFGLDVNKSFITAVISATLGSSGATVLGRTVVSNILKLVPGVGSAVFNTAKKLALGLATVIFGFLMSSAGFDATLDAQGIAQPASVTTAIMMGFSWLPVAMLFVAILLVVFFFDLDKANREMDGTLQNPGI